MSAASHSRHVCCATQQTCLSIVPHSRIPQKANTSCFGFPRTAKIDMLQNGWPEICCVTVSEQANKQTLKSPSTYTQNHPRTNPISIPKRDGRRPSRRLPLLMMHISFACVSLCAGVWVVSSLAELSLRDHDTKYVGPAVLKYFNGGIEHVRKTRQTRSSC